MSERARLVAFKTFLKQMGYDCKTDSGPQLCITVYNKGSSGDDYVCRCVGTNYTHIIYHVMTHVADDHCDKPIGAHCYRWKLDLSPR